MPEDLSEVDFSLAPGRILAVRGVHVLEIASLAVGAAGLVEVGNAPFGFVLVISLLVLAKFLDSVGELALVVVLAIAGF